MLKYSFQQLLSHNNRNTPPCIAVIKQLGILRRPRYIHRSSRRQFVYTNSHSINSICSVALPARHQSSVPAALRNSTAARAQHWQPGKRGVDFSLLRPVPRFTPSSSVKIELLNIRALTEKSTFILDHILDKKLDIMCLTETWQQAGVYKALNEACPPGYKYLLKARDTGRGGGLAIFHRLDLDLFPLPLPTYTTFEALAFSCKPPLPMTLLLIYRPPPKPKTFFFQEFQDLLTALCASTSNLVILGDINIHLNNPSCPSASDFLQLLDCFNLTQHVHDPTHLKGNTLDLVITHSAPINNLFVYDLGISDHSVIAMELPFSSPLFKPKRQISFRNIKNIKHDIFAQDLHYLSSTVLPSVSEAVDFYNNSLSSLLDLHAPTKTRSVTFARSAPWFTCELRQLKATGRVLERRFKATGLTVHKLAFKTHQKASPSL
ncbi:uncharacterized protein V6R79_009203 [Siganus canaliculatus]